MQTPSSSTIPASSRLILAFSCLGHLYSHLGAPIFFVVALALEREWGLSHGETVGLIVVGNLLYGLGAPLAGWLSDRWSAPGMMAAFFLGTGFGLFLAGLAGTPGEVMAALAVTGLFGSIYHPVGIAWLIKHAVNRGAALGINGIFGGVGPAVAALSAGLLTDLFGWRMAFLAPSVAMVATGVVFLAMLRRGIIVESAQDRRTDPPASRRDQVRAFLVMSLTMICTGLIYQATQSGLPKIFTERLVTDAGGVLGASMGVALVYLVAGALQVPAGWLADRYPLKTIYIGTLLAQVPLLVLAGSMVGLPLVGLAMAMVSANVGLLPAENALIARYSPSRWRGLAFGLKFVLAFGVAGLGVKMEGMLYDATGGFSALFTVLAVLASLAFLFALLLPGERREAVVLGVERA
ncbi:MAG: MFS transporter [Magnetospirillum sp. WYHS-4]